MVLVLVCLLVGACGGQHPAAPPQQAPPSEPAPDGVFIHVSHGPEDPHRVLMALRMAELMAADRDVLVYFDITGVEAVLADAPELELAPFPSLRTQLATLAGLGVPVYACPGCLEAAGHSPDELAEGVRVADKDAFFGFTDGRILTLDY
jgi:predicted peroxiredoxin